MQIFKHFLLAGSLVLAFAPSYLHSEDNDAQSAARAALEEKMRALRGESAQPVTPAAAPTAPAMVAEPKPAEPVATPVTEPAATPAHSFEMPNGASPDLIEQARQATRERIQELHSVKKGSAPVYQPAPTTTKAEVSTQPPTETMTTTTIVATPDKEDARAARQREAAAKAEAKARMKAEADSKAKADAQARKAAHESAIAQKKSKSAESAKAPEAPVVLAPLTGPPTGLSSSKEQALQALLQDYRADKVSPDEYQAQRAKILAEP